MLPSLQGRYFLNAEAVRGKLTDLQFSQRDLQRLLSHKYSGGLRDELSAALKTLEMAMDTLRRWLAVQEDWEWLRPQFLDGALDRALARILTKASIAENRLAVESTDKRWLELMSGMYDNFVVLGARERSHRRPPPAITRRLQNCCSCSRSWRDTVGAEFDDCCRGAGGCSEVNESLVVVSDKRYRGGGN